jgi:hypothetical protein
LSGQLDDIGREPFLIVSTARDFALRRAVLPERRTGATLGNKQLRADLLNAGAATRGGLEVSPGSLLKNELVQRQIRDRLAQTAVLELSSFNRFTLFDLQSAKFLAPAIIGHFAHANLADRFRYALSLRRHNINLPKLGDNLFSL